MSKDSSLNDVSEGTGSTVGLGMGRSDMLAEEIDLGDNVLDSAVLGVMLDLEFVVDSSVAV